MNGSPREHVARADWPDVDQLSHVIAEAFHQLAPSEWLIPDPVARREILPPYFRLLIEQAMTAGAVYTNTDRSAAALWFYKEAGWDTHPADYDSRLAGVTGPWVDRFRTFDAALDARRPTRVRHDHLAILAVHPDRQREGIGTALLAAYHQMLDRDDVNNPAYLEARDADTREIYLRHGYADHGSPIRLPQGPAMHPMWRRPRPTRDEEPRWPHLVTGAISLDRSTGTMPAWEDIDRRA